MKSLGVIGECMLELRADGENYRLGYGGDVFNTAVYATRLGLETRFFSATGDDHYSAYLLNAWAGEGVDTSHVRQLSGMKPSLYIIAIDSQGERSFQYWREASPFRHWLRSGQYRDDLFEKLRDCDCLYFPASRWHCYPTQTRHTCLSCCSDFAPRAAQSGSIPTTEPVSGPLLTLRQTGWTRHIRSVISQCHRQTMRLCFERAQTAMTRSLIFRQWVRRRLCSSAALRA